MLLVIYLILATKNNFHRTLVNPLTADNILKVTKNLLKRKANLLTFWWRLGEAQSPSMPLIWRLLILKLMLNRTRISVWYTEWKESSKTCEFNRNGKILLKWRIYPSPSVNGLERHFENTSTQYVRWNVK